MSERFFAEEDAFRKNASQGQLDRRGFLKRVAAGATAAVGSGALLDGAHAAEPQERPAKVEHVVRRRTLGKTGLKVPEIGFGGHSWIYERVPDGQGGLRSTTIDEAVEMIALGFDMGINFFDGCTAHEEHSVPAEALRRLGKKRDEYIISARLCHKQFGTPEDKDAIKLFMDVYLKLWNTDYFDILMLSNESYDTERSGFWEMDHSIEAVHKLKKEGKIRFAGFGSHFKPEGFMYAFKHYAEHFDICSMPYNIRHRAAEKLLPVAKQVNLGVATIKPFARGSLLKDRDLTGADAGVPRDMIAFVLENEHVDVSVCGTHTLAHVKENFSASWTPLTPQRRQKLDKLGAATACNDERWLEEGWLYA
jgi:aryl-alcohol dehydrogenase-like predicted oxidoreductase